jgi:hypothetical protein
LEMEAISTETNEILKIFFFVCIQLGIFGDITYNMFYCNRLIS